MRKIKMRLMRGKKNLKKIKNRIEINIIKIIIY